MRRSEILTATALSAMVVYIGCTQDFDQFEPDGTTFTTSSSTASAGGSGSGGAGGATASVTAVSSSVSSGTGMPCMMPGDCGVSTACVIYTCDNGNCAQFNQPDGADVPPGTQVPGDCKTIQCDGMGGEKTIADSTDIPPDDMNPCTTEECNGDTPANTPVAAGMTCPTGVCDGSGSCVECLMDGMNTGCMPGDTCDNGTCVGCNDGMQNGSETGVDCGGTCLACDGTACAMAGDCKSNNCVDGVCCATACTTACRACNVTGSEGTCSNLPQYQNDDFPMNACTNTMTCDGNGTCKLANGESCNNNAACASGNCAGGGGNKMCAP